MTDFLTWTREVATLLYRWSLKKNAEAPLSGGAFPQKPLRGVPSTGGVELLLQRLPWDSVFSFRGLGPGIK